MKEMNEKVKYCPICGWGAVRTEKGWIIYDSDKKFHHLILYNSNDRMDRYNMGFLNMNLCPLHRVVLR